MVCNTSYHCVASCFLWYNAICDLMGIFNRWSNGTPTVMVNIMGNYTPIQT